MALAAPGIVLLAAALIVGGDDTTIGSVVPDGDITAQRRAALNHLAISLRTLGERESGTARLEQAVAAYRAALEKRTRERVPLDWARTTTTGNRASRTDCWLNAHHTNSARMVRSCRPARSCVNLQSRPLSIWPLSIRFPYAFHTRSIPSKSLLTPAEFASSLGCPSR